MTEKRISCKGCIHDLGGGQCSINVEKECREGGGFELYGWKEKPSQSEVELLRHLLSLERYLHQGTRRKLEKADHDRKRYAKRIRFLDSRYEIICREYHAARAEIRILTTAITSLEKRLAVSERGMKCQTEEGEDIYER